MFSKGGGEQLAQHASVPFLGKNDHSALNIKYNSSIFRGTMASMLISRTLANCKDCHMYVVN